LKFPDESKKPLGTYKAWIQHILFLWKVDFCVAKDAGFISPKNMIAHHDDVVVEGFRDRGILC